MSASIWTPGSEIIAASTRNILAENFTVSIPGQSLFTFTNFLYTPGTDSLLVFINGVYQREGIDYNETSSSSITFISHTFVSGDTVSVVAQTEISSGPTNPWGTAQEVQVATEAQTVFTIASSAYIPNNGSLRIYINGLLQEAVDAYLETAGNIIFTEGLAAGDEVLFIFNSEIGLSQESAYVNYLPAGTGAVATDVQSKLREIVSVFDFMTAAQIAVVKSGAATLDVTAAIQAAVDYAKTFSTGCEIVFPEGKYPYSTLLVDSGNISFVGKGQKGVWLLKSGTTGDGLRFIGSSRIYGNSVSNILFSQASGNASSGSQLVFQNCGQVKIENVFIQNITYSPYIGITLQSCAQTDRIDGLTVQGCLNHGAYFKDCLDTSLSNCRSDANGGHGWYFSTCSGVYATNVTGYLNTISAFVADTVASASTSDGNHYHFYTNCVGDTSGQYNWAFTGLSDSGLSNCWGSTQSGAGDYNGFVVNACLRIEFNKCIAKNNNGHGLWALNACDALTITGGHYSDNGKTIASRNGIQIECPNVIVNGVTCTDSRAGGSKTQDSGIGITTNCNQAAITNNRFVGNKTTPYNIATTAMTSFFEDNNITDQSLSVASTGTLILPALGKCFTVTGTTTINVIGNVWPQREVNLVFASTAAVGATGLMKLTGTFNPTSNDTLCLFSDGTNWYEKSRSVNV